MTALTRFFDWTATSLGPFVVWPKLLRATLGIMLTSNHFMFICEDPI